MALGLAFDLDQGHGPESRLTRLRIVSPKPRPCRGFFPFIVERVFVTPAKAGVQKRRYMALDTGLRRYDNAGVAYVRLRKAYIWLLKTELTMPFVAVFCHMLFVICH